jgi:hypothetical protein
LDGLPYVKKYMLVAKIKEVITVHIAGNYSGESMDLSSNSLRTKKQGV